MDLATKSYTAPMLYIGGRWRRGSAASVTEVVDPATETVLDQLGHASQSDLDDALVAVEKGFQVWRLTKPHERQTVLSRAVALMRERKEEIATLLTLEQGKPLSQSRAEVDVACSMVQWYADQAPRIYGRIIPLSSPDTDGEVRKEPVGPCLLLSPWNMPVVLASRKLGGALAAGCSCILKPPEETPAAVAKVVECFVDAGVPEGVINLVYGIPHQVSEHLINSDIIRKISFTGSAGVGRELARLGSVGLKRLTLELGGHSPVLIFEDADIDHCVKQLVAAKYRNAGQLCHAPTRFYVHQAIYQRFADRFAAATRALRVGPGLDASTEVGPLANGRRVKSIEKLIEQSVSHATLLSGGKRLGERGYFYAPTVLGDVKPGALAMQEEPFGPVALLTSFANFDEAIAMANSTRYGLASYVFTDSAKIQRKVMEELHVGSIAINSTLATVAEAPFGGVRDSGYGYESGEEGLEGYLHTKFIHRTY
jgi:succinate-semialdehyde dehydrogenase/glutarate-semialdehyde dehydrogenase